MTNNDTQDRSGIVGGALTVVLLITLAAVSYTHLTLPTNSLV